MNHDDELDAVIDATLDHFQLPRSSYEHRPTEPPSFIARVGEEVRVAWPPVLSEPTAFSKLIYDAKLARGLPYVVSDGNRVQDGQQEPVLGAFATEALAAGFIETLPEYETGRYNLDGPADDGPENWT